MKYTAWGQSAEKDHVDDDNDAGGAEAKNPQTVMSGESPHLSCTSCQTPAHPCSHTLCRHVLFALIVCDPFFGLRTENSLSHG
jgi:hypothetical protein